MCFRDVILIIINMTILMITVNIIIITITDPFLIRIKIVILYTICINYRILSLLI